MYAAVETLFKKLFPPTETGRVILLGLDASGKTTLLYRLRLGELVTTIPTIGFNVEDITWSVSSGGTLKVTAWDVGGCDKIRPLWRHYLQNSTVIIFVLDAHDRDRMDEALSELSYFHLDTEKDPDLKGIPFLLLANKQDLSNTVSNDELLKKISALPDGAPKSLGVFGISATAEKQVFDAQIQPALDWLAHQTQMRLNPAASRPKETATPSANLNPRSPEALAAKLNSWLARLETDWSPDELLEQFNAISLATWDQYTHVRLAYVILTKFGRAKGKNMIFDGIKHYIENSPQTTGKTFHLTMTYFWMQIIHFGIISFHLPGSTVPKELTPDQFGAFLLLNQHVVDTNLWENYYSRSVIMTPAAKEGMVLPDKKSLPSIVQRDAPKLKTVRK